MTPFGIQVTPAQADTLSLLLKSMGESRLDGFGNPNQPGPILVRPKATDDELLILANGDTVSHTCGKTDDNALLDAA